MSDYRKDKIGLESEIVSLLQAGNTKVIGLLTKNYADTLYGIVLRIVKRQEVAEEVLQDVFLKIWQNANKYDKQKGRLFTWMANIARNTAIDFLRSARNARESKTGELDPGISNSSDLAIEQQTQDHGLQRVIATLDEKKIQIIDLIYFQGYTHREIATEFDIPLGTVKSRLRLALKELRNKLGDDKVRDILITILILITIYLQIQ